MPPRPAGTDGSDGRYRMVIEERYRRLAFLRKSLLKLVLGHSAYVAARTSWYCLPLLLAGKDVAPSTQAIAAGGLLAAVLYFWGSGFGKAQREQATVLLSYCAIAALLAVQALGATYWYHFHIPEEKRSPYILAQALSHHYSLNRGLVQQGAALVEGGLEVAGVTCLAAGAAIGLAYVLDRAGKLDAPAAAARKKNK